MNFDDLKKSWQDQETPNTEINTKGILKNVSSLPLEKLRKNVYKDMWMQIVSIILVGFYPQIMRVNEDFLGVFYIVYALFVFIASYYVIKMYLFYKRSSNFSMNSFESLYETYFEVRLYVQMYESFTYSLIPFMIIAIMAYSGMDVLNMEIFEPQKLLKLLLFVVIYSVLLTVLISKIWIKQFYGKYLKKIKHTLEQFKETETLS